jgi:hypothetical protein
VLVVALRRSAAMLRMVVFGLVSVEMESAQALLVHQLPEVVVVVELRQQLMVAVALTAVAVLVVSVQPEQPEQQTLVAVAVLVEHLELLLVQQLTLGQMVALVL